MLNDLKKKNNHPINKSKKKMTQPIDPMWYVSPVRCTQLQRFLFFCAATVLVRCHYYGRLI